jgi:hypothetical protein
MVVTSRCTNSLVTLMIGSFSIALGFALQPKELKNQNLQMLFYKIEN